MSRQLQLYTSRVIHRDSDLRVIRPFVYVREKSLRQFSNDHNLPVIVNPPTPDMSKERQRVKQLLAQQEILFPRLFISLRSALHPLIGFQVKECDVKLRRRFKPKETADDHSDEETDEEPVTKAD